jgi:hypothetical protein
MMKMSMKLRKMRTRAINKKIQAMVIERAGGYCELCSRPAQSSMALHHRKLKSRGGQDSVSNLIWIHHSCHNMSERSIHSNPRLSEEKGWMVSSWREPHDTPFVRANGEIVLLQDDGNVTLLMEGE